MSERIDEILRKLAADTPSGNPPVDDFPPRDRGLPGDPNCPICGGLGYLRRDLPLDHPEFGQLQPCSCRQVEIRQQIGRRLYALSNLDELGHLTFENFQTRGRVGLRPMQADSLERAYNQARQFAQSLNGWLLLQGGYGSGKTHLAAAIGNFAVSLGVPTLFITVPDLLDTLRFAFDDPESTFESRFDQIRQSALLILDDFGTQNATPWAQEKLFQIMNYRYINHLPLVVTTNLAIGQIEGRIRSRLEDPELVTQVRIFAPDYRRPIEDRSGSELSSLDMYHNMTFSTFEDRKGEGLPPEQLRTLERALKAAMDFARNPLGWLVFTGAYNCGKTHLAAGIANARAELGEQPVFVDVIELLDHLRATFNPASAIRLDERFEQYRTAPLLILDDLGAQASTAWAREKLYQLINYRYVAMLPTVITTSSFKEEIDPRLLSRMEDTRLCAVYHIAVPGYTGGSTPAGKPVGRRRRKV